LKGSAYPIGWKPLSLTFLKYGVLEMGIVVHILIPALGRLRQEDQHFEASLGHLLTTLSQETTRGRGNGVLGTTHGNT
jgi:hypothetical protein